MDNFSTSPEARIAATVVPTVTIRTTAEPPVGSGSYGPHDDPSNTATEPPNAVYTRPASSTAMRVELDNGGDRVAVTATNDPPPDER